MGYTESIRATALVESMVKRLEVEELALANLLNELQAQLVAVDQEIAEKGETMSRLSEEHDCELNVLKNVGERWSKRRRVDENSPELPIGDPIARLLAPFK